MNAALRPGQFRDRRHAGHWLAKCLTPYAGRTDVRVVALPRGGVPVAQEVSLELRAPLDVAPIRTLPVPGRADVSLGAVAWDGQRVLNAGVIDRLGIPDDTVEATALQAQRDLERHERRLHGALTAPQVQGHVALLIDDGLTSSAALRVAIRSLRRQGASRIVVGLPMASSDACTALGREADEVVCATTPTPFHSHDDWYADPSLASDDDTPDAWPRVTPPALSKHI